MIIEDCPFCGHVKPKLIKPEIWFKQEHGSPTEYFVRCFNCNAQGPKFDAYDARTDQQLAIQAWNRRPNEKASTKEERYEGSKNGHSY